MSLYVFGGNECQVATEAEKQNGFVEQDILRDFYSESLLQVRFIYYFSLKFSPMDYF